MSNFLISVAGVVVGGLITFFVARYYYKKAAKEFDVQINGLKELVSLVVQAIEAGGYAKVYRNEKGEPMRVVVDVPRMIVEEPDRARRVLGAMGIGLEFTDPEATG